MIINFFFCRTAKVFDCFDRRAIFSSFLTRFNVLYILFIPALVLLLAVAVVNRIMCNGS